MVGDVEMCRSSGGEGGFPDDQGARANRARLFDITGKLSGNAPLREAER